MLQTPLAARGPSSRRATVLSSSAAGPSSREPVYLDQLAGAVLDGSRAGFGDIVSRGGPGGAGRETFDEAVDGPRGVRVSGGRRPGGGQPVEPSVVVLLDANRPRVPTPRTEPPPPTLSAAAGASANLIAAIAAMSSPRAAAMWDRAPISSAPRPVPAGVIVLLDAGGPSTRLGRNERGAGSETAEKSGNHGHHGRCNLRGRAAQRYLPSRPPP